MLYPEDESFQDDNIDLMYLLSLHIRKVYNHRIVKDKRETTSNYGLISLMANASKFHIVCLNADSHNERMASIGNDVVTEGNTLLSDDEIYRLVALRINS